MGEQENDLYEENCNKGRINCIGVIDGIVTNIV